MVSFLALLPANPLAASLSPLKIHKAFSEQTRCPTEIRNYGATQIGIFYLCKIDASGRIIIDESVNLLPLARTIDSEIVEENRFVITGCDAWRKSFSIYFTTEDISTRCLLAGGRCWIIGGRTEIAFEADLQEIIR